ncbi:HNH endonuclease signature motif containing protein [Arthrobacter sp. H5]|uniref:HNH endonuclease signature motif containing protein n=1 Tax=Arthrobacter sp. H5 TaxID=1267973 RepID=UPI0004B5EE56|nr:HNH endonuclease signature motif containing protein [Arthrobacter sp. H5]
MAIASLEYTQTPVDVLTRMRSELVDLTEGFARESELASTFDLAQTVAGIEELSRVVEHLQVLGAHALERENVAVVGESRRPIDWVTPAQATRTDTTQKRGEFRDAADYLKSRLRISRSEARRRLRLAQAVVATSLPLTGEQGTPPLEKLGAALAEGTINTAAATLIATGIDRVRSAGATPDDLLAMERSLSSQACESDTDLVREVCRYWEAALDPDGREPSEDYLRTRQGVFLKGTRNGLHRMEIITTDDQFEVLTTTMNTATNPRINHHSTSTSTGAGTGTSTQEPAPLDQRTRAQQLLDGLTGACRLALATNKLPATGGHRPQVMVTIDYQTLIGEIPGAGHTMFGGPIRPKTARRIACDANILPILLGGSGEILDLGRGQRFFNATQRRALMTRDKGCAFPGCTIPPIWCEAHHITPWYAGGTTDTDNGALVCGHHHDLLEDGNWTIRVQDGIPWFIPPPYIDPDQTPRRNKAHGAYAGMDVSAPIADSIDTSGSDGRAHTLNTAEQTQAPRAAASSAKQPGSERWNTYPTPWPTLDDIPPPW